MSEDRPKQDDDLRPEYDRSDLGEGVRGKHFESYQAGTNLALLEPDVRAASSTDDAVNTTPGRVRHRGKRS